MLFRVTNAFLRLPDGCCLLPQKEVMNVILVFSTEVATQRIVNPVPHDNLKRAQ